MMRENILPADFQSNTSLVAPNHTWLDDFICIPLSLRWVIRNYLTLYRGRGGFLDKNKLTYNWDLESLTVHEKKTILCVDPQKKHSPLASLVDIHYIAILTFQKGRCSLSVIGVCHLHVVCGTSEVPSLLPWWRLHNCNQPSLLCLKYICIPNAANLPTLISNPVTIYSSSSSNDEIFIMCTDEGVGCRPLRHSSGTFVTPVGDIMYVSVSMTRADTCLQLDRHRALMAA